MTYCVGLLLDEGLIFASDSRTHAGVDNFAKFSKMTSFERAGERVIVLMSSGNLAGTQAVISLLRQRCASADAPNLWNTRTMFDAALLISDVMREVDRRDSPYLEDNPAGFNASFIMGGQIQGEPARLFRIYAEGNFIEAVPETPYLQTGETKYGKPILDRVIKPSTSLRDAAKCVLVSFDSTMRSNLSVGLPIDLVCYRRDSLEIAMRRRFEEGDPYFTALSEKWVAGVRSVFGQLPDMDW